VVVRWRAAVDCWPWNGWPRNSSAVSASCAIRHAICAGHAMGAREQAPRNAPLADIRLAVAPRSGRIPARRDTASRRWYDLGRLSAGCPCMSEESRGCSSVGLLTWLSWLALLCLHPPGTRRRACATGDAPGKHRVLHPCRVRPVGWEYDTVLVGRQEGASVVAGEGGSADPSAGLSAEADVPYAEPAFTGHLGKTLADSSHAYPERPVLSDQSAGSC